MSSELPYEISIRRTIKSWSAGHILDNNHRTIKLFWWFNEVSRGLRAIMNVLDTFYPIVEARLYGAVLLARGYCTWKGSCSETDKDKRKSNNETRDTFVSAARMTDARSWNSFLPVWWPSGEYYLLRLSYISGRHELPIDIAARMCSRCISNYHLRASTNFSARFRALRWELRKIIIFAVAVQKYTAKLSSAKSAL
jgi:hypothetical protein